MLKQKASYPAHLSCDSTPVFAPRFVETNPTDFSCGMILYHQFTIVINPQLPYDNIVSASGDLAPRDVISIFPIAQMAHSRGKDLERNTNNENIRKSSLPNHYHPMFYTSKDPSISNWDSRNSTFNCLIYMALPAKPPKPPKMLNDI